MSIKTLVINERPFFCISTSTVADPHLYPHKQQIRDAYDRRKQFDRFHRETRC